MKNILKQLAPLFEVVKVDNDGTEVEKLTQEDFVFESHPELVGNPKEYDVEKYESHLLAYNASTEVAIVPNMLGAWDEIIDCSAHGQCSFKKVVETFNALVCGVYSKTPFLGNYVPTDKKGNVLEKPYEGQFEIEANTKRSGWAYLVKDKMHGDTRYYDKEAYLKAMQAYQAALDRVVFFGWTLIWNDPEGTKTIENKNSNRIFFRIDGSIDGNIPNNFIITTNDQLFTAVPHHVELAKLK